MKPFICDPVSNSVPACWFLALFITTHNPVELAALVALRLAPAVLGLARAELPEVLRGSRDDILEQLKGDSSQRLSCDQSAN